MKESTALQIEAMKKQSYGIEIEGNNITREKAAKTAAEYFGIGRYEYTARRNGYESWSSWMRRDANGNSKRMYPLPDRTARSAKRSAPSSTTMTWNSCRD